MTTKSCTAFLFLVVILFVVPSTCHWQPNLQVKFIIKSQQETQTSVRVQKHQKGISAKPNLCLFGGFVKMSNAESGDDCCTYDS